LAFFRPNFRNLAFFQIGWPKNFIWLFGIISSWLTLRNLFRLLALQGEIFTSEGKYYYSIFFGNTKLFFFFRQHKKIIPRAGFNLGTGRFGPRAVCLTPLCYGVYTGNAIVEKQMPSNCAERSSLQKLICNM